MPLLLITDLLKVSPNKIKKTSNQKTIELVANKDILSDVCQLKNKPICIGFAAETENYINNANQKLKNKNCDAIILNDVSNSEIGLKSDDNEVYFITRDGLTKSVKTASKLLLKKLSKKLRKNSFSHSKSL